MAILSAQTLAKRFHKQVLRQACRAKQVHSEQLHSTHIWHVMTLVCDLP